MSVTGLPDPQGDYAVIMAKFAQDCFIKMNETTRSLVDRLGEGTETLTLRIGLVRLGVVGWLACCLAIDGYFVEFTSLA